MNQTVYDHCQENGFEQTRSRAYKKNDQAWVEQKNGSIVRRLVGYGRLSGLAATQILAQMYAVSRLYINFFQPSFKLKSKTRDGARVSKVYHSPMTPCDRLLGLPSVTEAIKTRLREELNGLDPVRLLHEIRASQRALADLAANGRHEKAPSPAAPDIATFLSSLSQAWQHGEVRPTHRKQPGAARWWRTRQDPFEQAWPVIEQWLEREATATAKQLLARLAAMLPDVYATTAQLRTLQRRVKAWRSARARTLIFGVLQSANTHANASESLS